MTVLFTLPITLGIVGLLGTLWDFSFFTPNLITMMGIAVGVDYALFIVSRYREERHNGRDKNDAIRRFGRHGIARGVLQRHDSRRRARRHAARADHDLPEPRRRRDHRGAGVGGVVDDAAARPCSRCSATGSTGPTWPASQRSLVFVAMLVGGARVGGALGGRGRRRGGSAGRARRLRRASGILREPHGQARRAAVATRDRRARASAPRAASGTASPASSWGVRCCGSPSAALFMIALSLPYWFQGSP